jgi:membrane protease YdiL (CAAX protease family)
MSSAIPSHYTGQWGFVRSGLYVLLVASAFIVAQTAGTIVVAVLAALRDPSFDAGEWMEQAQSNGVVLVVATFSSALVCVPLVWALVAHREGDAWRFLRVHATKAKTIAWWSGAVVVYAAATDLMTLGLDRPVVIDFMLAAYSSAPPFMLFLALVVAAPLFEELFFRGFLMSALEARGVSAAVATALSAALWASIHVQYDWYPIVMIFVGGLLLGAARIKTGSIVPCFVMHGLQNAIAFAETAYVAETLG